MSLHQRRLSKLLSTLLSVSFVLGPLGAWAAPLNLSQNPLFLGQTLDPNVIVTLDSSGSMRSAFAPDPLGYAGDQYTWNSWTNSDYKQNTKSPKRLYSAYWNPLYYDPTVDYKAPLKSDGTTYSTTFNNAWTNGFDTGRGSRDLRTGYKPTRFYDPSWTTANETTAAHTSDYAALGASSYTGGAHAYYYTYDGTLPGCTTEATSYTDQSGNRTVIGPTDACFVLHDVTTEPSTAPAGQSSQQNFANWYSFYRTRNLTTVSAATFAFSKLEGSVRLAFQALDVSNGIGCAAFNATDCKGWDGVARDNRIRKYSTNRSDFYSWLTKLPAVTSTPLRTALKRAGEYYRNPPGRASGGVDDPYAQDPQVTAGTKYACRPSYSLVMTDGFWNDSFSGSSGNPQGYDVDSTAATLPDGTAYAARAPFASASSGSLADVAFWYWSNDLRSDISDQVPRRLTELVDVTNASGVVVGKKLRLKSDSGGTLSSSDYWNPMNDPATWQHMVTYTIGLGLSRALPLGSPALTWSNFNKDIDGTTGTYGGSYASLVGGSVNWPTPTSDDINNVSDLWHAAINSRGKFYAADKPQDVVAAFDDFVNSLKGDVGAAGSAATSSTVLSSGTYYFKSTFHPNSNPKDEFGHASGWDTALAATGKQVWWGDLQSLSFALSTSNVLSIATEQWSAARQLIDLPSDPAYYDNNRTILSYDPGKASGSRGIAFQATAGNLSSSQLTSLTPGLPTGRTVADRVSWLRGSAVYEGTTTGSFRARPVTKLGDIINSTPVFVGAPSDGYSDPTYATFRSTTRTPMVYVGANDGMLHGFDATTGQEKLAYVPSAVIGNLKSLSDQTYVHGAYVDGNLTVGDAKFGSNWKSVLIGGLRAGGKGLFALDVTNPSVFSETTPNATVMWEFLDSSDSGNVGYSYGKPVITKLKSGDWVAIFGNGYNSTNGHAILYVAKLDSGGTWVLGTNFWRLDTGSGNSTTPNGLSSPAVVDIDGDGVADNVYAGDLYGNMWKFDLSSASSSSWAVGLGGNPLFTATSPTSTLQPITTAPEVTVHPKGGAFVLFGTGQAIQDSDVSNVNVQSFYGVWEAPGWSHGVFGRSRLYQHTLTDSSVNASSSKTVRTTDTGGPTWWDAATDRATDQLGWYVDLKMPTTGAQGERVIEDPALVDGKILFVSAVPNNDPCAGGGVSWLNEVDAITGKRLPEPPFDLQPDGRFDSDDLTANAEKPSGLLLSSIAGLPAFLKSRPSTSVSNGAASCIQYKVIKKSNGTDEIVGDPCSGSTGRLNWRDLMR